MDRYTILSERNLALLTEYWFACGKPRDILFPNKFTGEYLTISSVEQVIRRSAAAAGLSGGTPHRRELKQEALAKLLYGILHL